MLARPWPGRKVSAAKYFEICEPTSSARRITEELGGATVDIDQVKVSSERHVSIRRFLVQITVAALAFDQLLFDPQPFELDGRARGEDPKDEQQSRLGGHWPAMKDRQVPQDVSVAVEERHAQVAFDPHVDQILVKGKHLLDPAGVVAKASAHDVLAGCAVQVIFDVRTQALRPPVRDRPHASLDTGKLGDERVAHPDRGGKMPDERLEKDRAGAAGRSLDDRPQRGDLVIIRGGSVARLRARHHTSPASSRA